uniref:Uncharacterized protein n=1 Tax=Myoviridae sp. ctfJc17 TaxID=2827612 RepID=A0A8S5LQT9_9CAUD|nr:MAG TPA: hypothetical protein [Myoviridae sp. ctfJc17]
MGLILRIGYKDLKINILVYYHIANIRIINNIAKS